MNDVKPLTKKILESGLVDQGMAELMEKWKIIPEGASELVQPDALTDATPEQRARVAEELGEEAEKARKLRETNLDLNQLKWPATVDIVDETQEGHRRFIAAGIDAVVDRFGRFYFRAQDVNPDWFVPGYHFERLETSRENGRSIVCSKYQVLEVSPLYTGDQVTAIQVTAVK